MEQQEHIQKLADEYYEEGRARFFDHKLEEAAMLVQNALHLYKKCDDMLKYATALNLLGVIYGATGNETMAVQKHFPTTVMTLPSIMWHFPMKPANRCCVTSHLRRSRVR